MHMMLWPVLGLIVVGLAISLPLTWMLCRAGRRMGAMDSAGAGGHHKQLRQVPNVGGVAIFAAVAIPMLAGILAIYLIDVETLTGWFPRFDQYLPRLRGSGAGIAGAGIDDVGVSSIATAIGLLACMTLLHVMGLVDDRRPLGPWLKLTIQFAAASIMVIWFDVRLLSMFGDVPSIIVTVLWIVVITNAMNFLDNMDGLAGGVAAIGATLLMAACIVIEQWFIAGTLALLVGALCGFLVFNFPPAKIFMGDGGSMVIGFLLGVLTARTTYYDPHQVDYALGTGWYSVFMPLIVLAIPLYDLVTVTVIRLRQGRNPLVGDQQHFSHRLVQRGLSPRGAVVVIWAAAAVTGIGGVSLGQLELWQATLVGTQTVLVLLMLGLLEHASRHAVRKDDDGSS